MQVVTILPAQRLPDTAKRSLLSTDIVRKGMMVGVRGGKEKRHDGIIFCGWKATENEKSGFGSFCAKEGEDCTQEKEKERLRF